MFFNLRYVQIDERTTVSSSMTHAQILRELRVCLDVILKAYPEKDRIKFVNKNTVNALYNVLTPRKNVQYNFQ